MKTVSSPHLPSEADFTSRLRSPSVTARVGLWLGVCFGLACGTKWSESKSGSLV